MTDHLDPSRRDPQAPRPPDELRGDIGASSTLVGGAPAGDPTPDAIPGHPPGPTLEGAGLTDHDQPAEGGRGPDDHS